MTLHQGLRLVDVGLLAGRQDELDRVAQAVDGAVDLGPEPAPASAQRLIAPAPFFRPRRRAGGPGSRSCRGSPLQVGVLQRLEDPLPDPCWPSGRTASRQFHSRTARAGRARGAGLADPKDSVEKRRLSSAVTPGSPGWPGRRSLMRSQSASEISWRPISNAPVAQPGQERRLSCSNPLRFVHTAYFYCLPKLTRCNRFGIFSSVPDAVTEGRFVERRYEAG